MGTYLLALAVTVTAALVVILTIANLSNRSPSRDPNHRQPE